MAVSPDVAFAMVSVGVLLVYWELCAPGLVIPGAVGLALTFGGGWSLAHYHPMREGLFLLDLGVVLQWLAISKGWTRMILAPSLVCLCAGSTVLLPKPNTISPFLTVPVSLFLGILTLTLGRLAVVGHRRKRSIPDLVL